MAGQQRALTTFCQVGGGQVTFSQMESISSRQRSGILLCSIRMAFNWCISTLSCTPSWYHLSCTPDSLFTSVAMSPGFIVSAEN